MTPRLAAALAAQGVDEVADLAERGLRTLEEVAERAESDNPPTVYALAAMQVQACRRADTGMVALRVLNKSGKPISGAVVRVAGQRDETDRNGWAAFDAVTEGAHRIEVQPNGTLVPYGLGAGDPTPPPVPEPAPPVVQPRLGAARRVRPARHPAVRRRVGAA